MSDSDSEIDMNTPPDIVNAATNATKNLLPQKSRAKYEKAYKDLLHYTALSVNGARKYDIEAEAHSIYGTDLRTVLMKFRHSPEYLRILGERGTQISNQLTSILHQLVFFYTNEMKTNIMKTLKPNEDVEKVRQKLMLRSKYNPLRARLRQADEDEVTPAHLEEYTRSPIEILDNYVEQRRNLPASYINHFRGMGYEYYGRVLHALVKNLGGDVAAPDRSTMGGDGPFITTTEHVTLHTVTTPPDVTPFVVSNIPGEDENTQQTIPPEPPIGQE